MTEDEEDDRLKEFMHELVDSRKEYLKESRDVQDEMGVLREQIENQDAQRKVLADRYDALAIKHGTIRFAFCEKENANMIRFIGLLFGEDESDNGEESSGTSTIQ